MGAPPRCGSGSPQPGARDAFLMTGTAGIGHLNKEGSMLRSTPADRIFDEAATPIEARPPVPIASWNFAEIYDAQFAFVWRSLRRLGVDPSGLDDAAQDVFLVVHRRLPEFEGRASLKTWVYEIVRRVARDHRRTKR